MMAMYQLNIVTRQANLSQWRYYQSIFNHSIAELFAKSSILERLLVFKCFVLPFIYSHFCATVIAQLCPNKILICSLTRFTCDINSPYSNMAHHSALQCLYFFSLYHANNRHVFFSTNASKLLSKDRIIKKHF